MFSYKEKNNLSQKLAFLPQNAWFFFHKLKNGVLEIFPKSTYVLKFWKQWNSSLNRKTSLNRTGLIRKFTVLLLLICFSFFLSAAQRSFLHTLLHTHTGEMMIIRNTLLRQKFLGIFRAYKVLLSLAFLLLCGIITVPVTYSTFYSTSSAEYYVIDTV